MLGVLLLPAPAPAVVLYESFGGFNPNGFNLFRGLHLVPAVSSVSQFSWRGALCPAPGTTDYLCGWLHGESGVANGRLFLKAGVALKRTNAQPPVPSVAAYAGATLRVVSLGGYVGTPPKAAFYFGLSGGISKSASDGVVVDAFSIVNLYAGSGQAAQCFGFETSCLPGVKQYVVHDWEPSRGFGVHLRSDVAIGVPMGVSGYDAEAVADFADTLELLAIELRDENDQPIPGVSLYVPDEQGNPMLSIPSTPPEATTTTTTLAGPTTTVGGGTSTTTTTQPVVATLPVAGKTLAMKDHPTKPAKRKFSFVAEDGAIAPAALDPTVGGAQVVVASPHSGQTDAWTLPASGWTSKKGTFKYADRARAFGPVIAASIKRGKITVVAKGQPIAYLLVGTGPQQAVDVRVLLPATTLCARFPGADGEIKQDDPVKGTFKAVAAEAPPGCPLR